MAILKIKDENGNVISVPVVKSLVVKEYVEGGDISKFCKQEEVTGANIVTCEYVNDNEHKVEVQLSSDTITDFSGVEVKCVCENIFDISKYPFEEKGFYNVANGSSIYNSSYRKTNKSIPIRAYRGKKLYLYPNTGSSNTGLCFYDEDGNFISGLSSTKNTGIVVPENANYISLGFREDSINEVTISLFPVASYKQYAEKTYTANADGTIDGVKSIAGTMNLICDTESINISAKYYLSPNADYDRFWDNAQLYGNRTNYQWKFAGNTLTDETFRPKYDIKPTESIANMFYQSNGLTNIADCLDKAGVIMDLSGATNMDAAFYYASYLTTLPPLDVSNVTSMSNTFRYCGKLKSLTLLNINPSCVFSSTFANCNNLTEFRCTGTIGNNFTFSHITMPNESVQNIIDCLADLTGATTKTLTLSTNTKAAMTEEQIAAVTAKNWTLA